MIVINSLLRMIWTFDCADVLSQNPKSRLSAGGNRVLSKFLAVAVLKDLAYVAGFLI